jgi:hypothetical protein
MDQPIEITRLEEPGFGVYKASRERGVASFRPIKSPIVGDFLVRDYRGLCSDYGMSAQG